MEDFFILLKKRSLVTLAEELIGLRWLRGACRETSIMVGNVCTGDYVALDRAKAAWIQRQGEIVEQNVVIWAKNNDVFRYVWPIMWLTKRLYVMGFGVGLSTLQQERLSTHLAAILMERLDFSREFRVAQYSVGLNQKSIRDRWWIDIGCQRC